MLYVDGGRVRVPATRDFAEAVEWAFRPEGTATTPAYQSASFNARSFKFKDYDPRVFAHLRRHAGVQTADYLNSLCVDSSFIE